MIVREDQPISGVRNTDAHRSDRDERPERLSLLLSSTRSWHDGHVVDMLPPLLEPMGIGCVTAGSADEAAEVIGRQDIHIAIVDLAMPLSRDDQHTPGGPRILQLLRRLDQPPPTVVVRPPQATQRENVRGLTDALREGAFAVLDRPVHWETILQTLRRLVRRHYAGHWPETS